jgi:hypothetical protein
MSEPIVVKCPVCRTLIRTPATTAGKQMRCGKCQSVVAIPQAVQSSAESVAVAALKDDSGPVLDWRQPVKDAPRPLYKEKAVKPEPPSPEREVVKAEAGERPALKPLAFRPVPVTIPVICPKCDARMKAPFALAGTAAKCPRCRESVRVPTLQPEEPVLELDEEAEPQRRPVNSNLRRPLLVKGAVIGIGLVLLAVAVLVDMKGRRRDESEAIAANKAAFARSLKSAYYVLEDFSWPNAGREGEAIYAIVRYTDPDEALNGTVYRVSHSGNSTFVTVRVTHQFSTREILFKFPTEGGPPEWWHQWGRDFTSAERAAHMVDAGAFAAACRAMPHQPRR